jgi:phosphoribosylglycinamide formyltransferase 1
MAKLRVAVLISGSGTNLQALLDAAEVEDYPAKIVLVISNRPGVHGLERANKAGVPTKVIDHTAYDDRDSFDAALDNALDEADVGLVCLAGFMRLLNPTFVGKWRDRLINIHPSLLPSFKGIHTHQRALDSGVRFHGCTVHLVRPELDGGPIILQAIVPVHGDDDVDSLAARVLEQEHIAYPEALRLIASGDARISGNIVKIATNKWQKAGLINPAPKD